MNLSNYNLSLLKSEYWLLWFKKSHSFSVVDTNFKNVLDTYFTYNTSQDFLNYLVENGMDTSDAPGVLENIENYLEDCMYSEDQASNIEVHLDKTARIETFYYRFRDFNFQVNFNSSRVVPFFHKALAHLQRLEKPKTIYATFDIQIKNGLISLFVNEDLIQSVPGTEYHKIQGKFNFCLQNKIYNKSESDWIATLHGCSIAKNNNSILLIGHSGSGKSTASALLAAHGYEVLADDISALASDNLSIYNNPSAISLKSGSFELVSQYFNTLGNIDSVQLNANKGQLKFLPSPSTSKTHYPCKAIVLINYSAGAETNFSNVSLAEILEPLIPDSWISSEQEHVLKFMNWLDIQQFYKLTYSKTEEILKEIDALFQSFENK